SPPDPGPNVLAVARRARGRLAGDVHEVLVPPDPGLHQAAPTGFSASLARRPRPLPASEAAVKSLDPVENERGHDRGGGHREEPGPDDPRRDAPLDAR